MPSHFPQCVALAMPQPKRRFRRPDSFCSAHAPAPAARLPRALADNCPACAEAWKSDPSSKPSWVSRQPGGLCAAHAATAQPAKLPRAPSDYCHYCPACVQAWQIDSAVEPKRVSRRADGLCAEHAARAHQVNVVGNAATRATERSSSPLPAQFGQAAATAAAALLAMDSPAPLVGPSTHLAASPQWRALAALSRAIRLPHGVPPNSWSGPNLFALTSRYARNPSMGRG